MADGLEKIIGQNVWELCNTEKHGSDLISHIYIPSL